MNKGKGTMNKVLSQIFTHMADLYRINGVAYKPAAYERASKILAGLAYDAGDLYKKEGLGGIKKLSGIGERTAVKIEEYIKKKKISAYEELKEKTALREIITTYFRSKDISLEKLKRDAKKEKIIYARHVASAKQLLELAGSAHDAKKAIATISAWASSRGLDYTLETVSKRWLELDTLKPKEKVRKAFYKGDPMVWSQQKKKWYVIKDGEWLEFADTEDKIKFVEE
ncbi:MAG: helix-hairpin-helix domain-containing protein [bacterium]|nr:helix-hairpin-helix domain-containing protein [bacterium]